MHGFKQIHSLVTLIWKEPSKQKYNLTMQCSDFDVFLVVTVNILGGLFVSLLSVCQASL